MRKMRMRMRMGVRDGDTEDDPEDSEKEDDDDDWKLVAMCEEASGTSICFRQFPFPSSLVRIINMCKYGKKKVEVLEVGFGSEL